METQIFMQAAGGSGWMGQMVLIGLLFLVFYFLLFRPQQQRMKKHQAMLSSLKKGDNIVTSGGVHAKVVSVKEDVVEAEIADGIVVKIARPMISDKVEKASKDSKATKAAQSSKTTKSVAKKAPSSKTKKATTAAKKTTSKK